MLMRVCAIACGLAALSSAPAFGQGLGLGAKGGLNVATQRFEGDAPGLDPRLGIVAGVFATMPILSWLDLQAEGLYAMKGATLDIKGAGSSVGVEYLEVPILARLTRNRGGALQYFVTGGPSIGVRLRARVRTKFGNSTEERDVGDELERLDYGAAAGGGIARGPLSLEGRYTLGLKDIDKDRSDTVKVTNRVISVALGIRF